MSDKNTKRSSSRTTYLGLIGQIIGTPLGTYAGYKTTSKLTDNKALRILGTIAGGIAGNILGDQLGDALNAKRMLLRELWAANSLGPEDVLRLIEQSSRDRLLAGRTRLLLRKLIRLLKAQE